MSWLAFMPKMRQLPMRPMSKMQILVFLFKKYTICTVLIIIVLTPVTLR